jgi:hypothetical protein
MTETLALDPATSAQFRAVLKPAKRGPKPLEPDSG